MPEMKFGPPAEMLEMPAHITVGHMVAQADYLDLLRDGINAHRKAILEQYEMITTLSKLIKSIADERHNLGQLVESQQRMIQIIVARLGLLEGE